MLNDGLQCSGLLFTISKKKISPDWCVSCVLVRLTLFVLLVLPCFVIMSVDLEVVFIVCVNNSKSLGEDISYLSYMIGKTTKLLNTEHNPLIA